MCGYRAKDKAPVLKVLTNLFLLGSRKRKVTENPFQVKLFLQEKQTSQATAALAAVCLSVVKAKNISSIQTRPEQTVLAKS